MCETEYLLFKFKCPDLATIALGSALILTAPTAQAQGLAGPYLAAVQASYRNDYVTAAQFFTEAVANASERPVERLGRCGTR